MGVDFIIDNAPRYVVTGTIVDWRGESTYDGPLTASEISSLFEDPPESADIKIRTVPLEPPLADGVEKLRVGMPYGAFARLRAALAATINVELEWMWGFRPMALEIARMRGLPENDAARAPDYQAWEREQVAWWDERARQWEDVDSGLVPLLNHSDCDGELSPEECRTVAPALAEAITKLPAEDVPPGVTTYRSKAQDLLGMIEACAKYDRQLLFR